MTGAQQAVETPPVPDLAAERTRKRKRFRLPTNSVVVVGALAWLLFVVVAAVLGPFFVTDPAHQDLSVSLVPPSFMGGVHQHILGADQLGRDELSMLLNGTRVSLAMSLVSLLTASMVGVAVGLAGGYFGGPVDTLLMRVVDVQMSIPGILLAVTVVSVLGPKIPSILLVLALYAWVVYARVTRSEVLSIRQREYVTAAIAVGCSPGRILWTHVLRNVVSPIIVISTLELPNLVIIQASLGYLGLGIPPPTVDLGGMISNGQKFLTAGEWWLTLFPGLVIALVVLAINVVGDWLRDYLDPRAHLVNAEAR